MKHLRENILGVQVSVINMVDTLNSINQWIVEDQYNYICVTPAHGIMECYQNTELQNIFNSSGLTTPDGMAIVWILKLLGHKNVSRVYGPDLLLETCKFGLTKKWRHYFYGGTPGVADQLIENLQDNMPNLHIVGSYSPPFHKLSSGEDANIASIIKSAKPDIIWVGISSPKQERWMHAHIDSLGVPTMIGIGAAFDFISGVKKQAPVWVQRFGLEWLYRLFSEPKRLLPRYKRYPMFVILVIFQLTGLNKIQLFQKAK